MNIYKSFDALKDYCEKEGFKGWDPYDGLNSMIFQATLLKHFYFPRLAMIQFFKRSPINFRRLFFVPKEFNPKGLGLFLHGYCNLFQISQDKRYMEKIVFLADKLLELQSKGFSGACWGYNFDWQSRAFFLPKTTPTVVATSFITDALFKAYDITQKKEYLDSALSSTDFVIHDLNRTKKERGFIFSYSPFDTTRVYNASLLGSRLLARGYHYTKNETLKRLAKESVQAVVDSQREDGSWIYGELELQNWVDSFHTGYNLECIYEYQKYTEDNSYDNHLQLGLNYYIDQFFLQDGTPKYYNNKIYSIDIHAPAQLIATLYKMNELPKHRKLAEKVLQWTIENMQDNKGYFYYQLKPTFSSKIPYMRWAEAWMFYGMSFYLKEYPDAK